jgi:hypothetical protein
MGRSSLAAAVVTVLMVLGGCAAAGQRTVTRGDSGTWQSASFARVRFQVPSSWAVHDLATDAGQCVRFDRHAVYLGHTGARTNCPAGVLGRTEAVQIEPLDGQSRAHLLPDSQPQTIAGLAAEVQPFGQTTHSTVAVFDSLGVVVTVTWSQHPDVAQQILQSIHGS